MNLIKTLLKKIEYSKIETNKLIANYYYGDDTEQIEHLFDDSELQDVIKSMLLIEVLNDIYYEHMPFHLHKFNLDYFELETENFDLTDLVVNSSYYGCRCLLDSFEIKKLTLDACYEFEIQDYEENKKLIKEEFIKHNPDLKWTDK